jgi:hypothetical protein
MFSGEVFYSMDNPFVLKIPRIFQGDSKGSSTRVECADVNGVGLASTGCED